MGQLVSKEISSFSLHFYIIFYVMYFDNILRAPTPTRSALPPNPSNFIHSCSLYLSIYHLYIYLAIFLFLSKTHKTNIKTKLEIKN